MSSTSPSFEYKPTDLLQKEKVLYEAWKAFSGADFTFAEWQATNLDLACQPAIRLLEDYEGTMVALCTSLFDEFAKNNLAIKGSFGSSREGWLNAFRPYCRGLQIVDYYEDPLRGEGWPVDKKVNGKYLWELSLKELYSEMIKEGVVNVVGLAPGEFNIFFDNLDEKAPIADLFKRLIGAAEFTKEGKTEVKVEFGDSTTRVYKYTNVLEEDYTRLDLNISVTYKKRGLTYRDGDIVDEIRRNFEKSYTIGQNIYPNALFCLPNFDGIAAYAIKYQIGGSGGFKDGVVESQFGQRFKLNNIAVEVV